MLQGHPGPDLGGWAGWVIGLALAIGLLYNGTIGRKGRLGTGGETVSTLAQFVARDEFIRKVEAALALHDGGSFEPGNEYSRGQAQLICQLTPGLDPDVDTSALLRVLAEYLPSREALESNGYFVGLWLKVEAEQ